MNTKNGDAELSSAKGILTIHSDFGLVTINNGENVTLDVDMKNGKFEFSGSLNEDSAQSILNQFGDISFTLPDDSAFNLDVETKFGSISSDFPITITGKIDPLKWNAKLNEGGSNFKIVTDNGNINLIISE